MMPLVAHAQSLADLDAVLIAEDLSILRSEQQIEIATARIDQARANLFPQVGVSLTTSQTERTQFGLTEDYAGEDYSLVVQQSLFDRPSVLEVDRQRLVATAQHAIRMRTQQDRRLELLQGFTRWTDAASQVRALKRRLETVNQRVTQLDELYVVKRVSVVELLTVKNERQRVRSELAQAQANQSLSRSYLVSLLGDDALPSDAPRVGSVDAWPFGLWIDEMAENVSNRHPSVLEAVAQRGAAEVGVAQTESAWLPSVKAEIRYRETNVGANDAETFPTETVSARLVLTWDVFDSGARAARQQEASARLQDAQLALDQVNREVDRLKASSVSEVDRIRQAWEAARAEVASAEQLVAAADRSFELGVGTIADTLLALDRLVEAEIRLTSRWLEGAIATAQLAQSANRLDRALIELVSEEFIP